MKSHIGSFVLYENGDSFCFGLIKREVTINTMEGLRPAFVLERRLSNSNNLGIQVHLNDTLLRVDKIDVDRDVFDVESRLDIPDDALFLIVMKARQIDPSIPMRKRMREVAEYWISRGDEHFADWAKETLKLRLDRDTVSAI